jgi:WD40 repeat protein/predicted Ser/Thr protein kinase
LLQERYRVKQLLGEGSFSKTYEVDDQGTVKILKVLLLNDPKAVALFEQEARVLSQLRHPGIPHVDANGFFTYFPKNSHQPLHCLVMEKIDGINLDVWQRQPEHQPLAQAHALNWLKQLVEILHQVHQQLYFHRDIKPSNILLTPNGQLVLIDFGSAREVSDTYLVKVNDGRDIRSVASPGYTPIEQAQGKAVPQSDFFALGRTFVYLLTGKSPNDFAEDPRTGELLWQHQAPQVSKAVTDLLDDLMAVFPAHRPHNAQDILQRLTAIDHSWQPPQSANQPPEFTPSLMSLQLNSWIREHGSSATRVQKFFTKAIRPRNLLLITGTLSVLGVAGVLLYLDLGSLNNQSALTSASNTLSPSPSSPKDLVPLPTSSVPPVQSLAESASNPNTPLLEPIISIDSGASNGLNSIAMSPNGNTLASGSRDGMLRLWKLTRKPTTTPITGRALGEDLYGENIVAFSPDGKLLASGSDNHAIQLWDVDQGKLVTTLKGHSAWVSDLKFTPDGKHLISSSFDRTIKVWALGQTANIQPIATKTLRGHKAGISALALSLDSKTLVSSSFDNTITLWDLDSGKVRNTFQGNPNPVFALAISPNGEILVSGNGDGTIQLWNLKNTQLIQTIQAHQDEVRSLAISSNGRILASGSSHKDNTIKIWKLPTGRPLSTLKGHSDEVRSIAFSPNGETLVSGSLDNTIKIWPVP